MSSAIDATKPAEGNAYTADMRANFAAAKSEIEDLQDAANIHAATAKAAPDDADELGLLDSAATYVLKKFTWANLKARIKAYTDTLYPAGSGTCSGANTGDQVNITGNAATATTASACSGNAATSSTCTGNAATSSTCTGNAATATALATARAINGVNFNGTADIEVLAAATHAAASKATPVDNDEIPLVDSAASNGLKKLTWANVKATLAAYFDGRYPAGSGTSSGTNTGDQTTITGNAATATKLATARTINGASFDGSANVEAGSFTMQLFSGAGAPADATTYFIGASGVALNANATAKVLRAIVPKNANLRRVDLNIGVGGTLGTTEQSTVNLRKNDTTDTPITAVAQCDQRAQSYTLTGSLAFAAGDQVELKWLTPTWATNPTNVIMGATLYFDQG